MKISISLYFKIALLVIVLAGVFYAIRNLRTESVEGAFNALGIEPGAPGSPGLVPAGNEPLKEGEERRSLCPTRIHAIRFPNGTSVVESKEGLNLDWAAEEEGITRQLSYLAIEKWLSLHCQFVTRPAPPLGEADMTPQTEPVPYVDIEYIDNTTWNLTRSGEAFFAESDPKDRFYSPDLEAALEDLKKLAGFLPADGVDGKPAPDEAGPSDINIGD